MATKPRIFLSHSTTKDREAAKFREALVDELRQEGYPVFVDKDDIDLGENWRSTINAWMGGCDVGIVLLSRDALTSDSVFYETSILSYRKEFDPSFMLIPVTLHPVDYNQVTASRLGVSLIQHREGTIKQDQGDAITKVLEKLAGLESGEARVDESVRRLAPILRRVDDEHIEDHLRALNVDLPPWVPGEDKIERLALRMLAAGLVASRYFIRAMDGQFAIRRVDVIDMVDVLACSWVDSRAVEEIARAAMEQRVISINAEDPVTAYLYAIRVALEKMKLLPHKSWKVGQIHANVDPPDETGDGEANEGAGEGRRAQGLQVQPGVAEGISTLEQIYDQVLMALELPFRASNQKQVLSELKKVEGKEPVFVALPARWLTVEVLRGLLSKLEGVAFFLLSGDGRLDDDVLQLALAVQPPLEPRTEEWIRSTYHEEREYHLQGR